MEDSMQSAQESAMLGGIIGGVVALLFIVILIVAQWKIFTKAGQPGWAAFVPVYNIIVMLEMTGKPTWWALMILMVPIANIVFMIKLMHAISLGFGKGTGFTLGQLFLPFIFIPVLGFGKAEFKAA